MRALILTAALLLGLSLACGSDHSPSPPPDGGSTGGGGDDGAGGGGSGGGGTGGGGDGGGTAGGSGGGDQGGGSGTNGGSGGGDGGGTAGGGPGGGAAGPVTSADGSVTIERLDADAECDALVPTSAPNALTMRTVSDTPACGPGASDGAGNVVVAARIGQGFVRWQVFTAAGAPEGTFPTSWNGLAGRLGLVLQAEGFQGLQVTDLGRSTQQVDVVTYSGNGTLARTVRATPSSPDRLTVGWVHAEDPQGGSALAHFDVARTGGCAGTVSRFDATGALRSTGSYGSGGDCRAIGAAVSARGETLVAENFDQTVVLWWLAPDGHLVQPQTVAGSVSAVFPTGNSVFLAPLLDGSIAASEGGTWTRRVPHLGDHAEAAPGWLSSRPGFTFRYTRGAKGYALFPPPDQRSDDCSQRIELVAPSGRLCGRVTLKGDGGSCNTAAVDQGWDGTVVQESPRDRCAWRTWPRLLAGG